MCGVCGRQRIIERCLALDKQRTRLAARPQSLVDTVWVVSSTLLCFSVCPSACWPVGTLTFWPVACLRTQRQKINKMAPSAGHWLSYGAHSHWTPSPTPTSTATRTLAKRHTACKWKCKRASYPPPPSPHSFYLISQLRLAGSSLLWAAPAPRLQLT